MAFGQKIPVDHTPVMGICVRCSLAIPLSNRQALREVSGWQSTKGPLSGSLKWTKPTGRVLCGSCASFDHPTEGSAQSQSLF